MSNCKTLFLLSAVLVVLFSFSVVVSVGFSAVIWTQSYGGAGDQDVASVVETSDGGFALFGTTKSVGYVFENFWLVKTDFSGDMEWNKTYGGNEGDIAQSIIETSDGGFALVGYTDSFDAMFTDFWLVKTDAAGNVEWNKTYGQWYRDYAYSVVETSDGGFALAGYSLSVVGDLEDYFLVKTDSSGNLMWNKTYGGPDREYAYSVVETSDGGFALAGYSSFSNSDFWLVKTDEFGNMEWNKTYGGDGLDRAYSMIKTSDGGFLLAGKTMLADDTLVFWLVKTDEYGNMEWNKTYGESHGWSGYPVIETSDVCFAFASRAYIDWETTGYDCWLIKIDATGNVVWNQTYTEEDDQSVDSLIETSDGGFALAGSNANIASDGDFWLIRTDEKGIPEFPSWIILPLFLMATVFAVFIKKSILQTKT
jgi:hypothetical protein